MSSNDDPKKSAENTTTPEERNKERKQSRTRAIIGNILVILTLGVVFFWLIKDYFHIGDKDFSDAVQVEEFINPINTHVSAYITQIRYNEHQPVKQGDTLVILDDRELKTQLAQAEADYQSALAGRNSEVSTVKTVSNNIAISDADVDGARAKMLNAQHNLRRYENLLKDEAVTKQQYDMIKTEYESNKASYESSVEKRKSAVLSTQEEKSKLAVKDADVKNAAASVAMAKLKLSYVIITAPTDGVMGRRSINEGQLLQQGQQVGTIVQRNNKWVTANLLEDQLSKVKVGTKINMTADALNNQIFHGVVTAISAATGAKYSNVPVDNSSGNFVKVQQRIPVRIEFTDENKQEDLDKLRAGMNMQIKF